MNSSTVLGIAQRFATLSDQQRHVAYEKIRQQGLSMGDFPVTQRPDMQAALWPVSHAQARQWFLWRLDPDSSSYHISEALLIRGVIDNEALRLSFNMLIRQHEALRTVFVETDIGLFQHCDPGQQDALIEMVDLSEVDAKSIDARVASRALECVRKPFDLTKGPLLRVLLISKSQTEHVLVVVMHHVIADGWSMQLLLDDFVTYYCEFSKRGTPALKTRELQYVDYSIWQRQWLAAGEKERQLAYWRSHLGDEHPVLELPTDHPRRQDGRYIASRYAIDFPDVLTDSLHALARDHDATLFVVLLAGMQIFLRRYSGLDDIRVGVPIANRSRAEMSDVVGIFVNTQVLRGVLASGKRLCDFIDETRDAVVGAQMHQDLPFEQLVEALCCERGTSRSPLFQILLNHQLHDDRALLEMPGLDVLPFPLGDQDAQFELAIDTIENSSGKVRAIFSYAKELFDYESIVGMVADYLRILRWLSEARDGYIGNIGPYTSIGSATTHSFSSPRAEFRHCRAFHTEFERMAYEHPDRTALVMDEERVSYGRLNAESNQLAHRLIREGVKPETPVGLCVGRSISMVVGILAILKSGATYVPLDPSYPVERRAHMLRDSGVTTVLTQRSVDEIWAGMPPVAKLYLDDIGLARESVENVNIAVHLDSLSYVIYTSGSTGLPKGVAVSHHCLVEHAYIAAEVFSLTPADCVLQFSTLNFDGCIEQLFAPLVVGASVVLRGNEVWGSSEFYRQLLRHQITVVDLTTAYWLMLIRAFSEDRIQDYGRLRQVNVGGEAMPPEGLRLWRDANMAHIKLLNTYGPTEASVTVSALDCAPYIELHKATPAQMPLGSALAGRTLRVVNGDLAPIVAGVPGELLIGGALLARGYLGRASLTAERFVADDLSTDGGRVYRTGDVVRWTADGDLVYLGRVDNQVKIRGFRVETGEIEGHLLDIDGVDAAVVLPRLERGETCLAAYVSSSRSPRPTVGMLRKRLENVLPHFMMPSSIVILDTLPLNGSGKIDRAALLRLEVGISTGDEEPAGDFEVAIAHIWKKTLGLDRIGRRDDFFALGGHSLLALSLVESMRKVDIRTEVRTLFTNPVFASFVEAVSKTGASHDWKIPPNLIPPYCSALQPAMVTLIELTPREIELIEAAVPGGASNVADIYPLAPLQEGMVFHHILDKVGDAYVTPLLIEFRDRDALERFVAHFNRVIDRHDILRTAVLWEGLRKPVQVVYRKASLQITWLLPITGVDAVLQLFDAIDPTSHRIDIRRAPMVHAVAIEDVSDARWLLQLPSHHLVMDHTTLQLIVEEMTAIQQGSERNLPQALPFRNFVAQALLTVSETEHERFFSDMLGDVTEPTAPFGLGDARGNGRGVRQCRMRLPLHVCMEVRAQAKRFGVTAAALFHLAWGVVVAKAAGRNDVVFGTVLFGRSHAQAGAERALGMFINTLPIRLKLGGRSVEAALRATHVALTALLRHEHASLSLALQCSGLPGGTPLFTSLLNFRHSREAGSGVSGWEGARVIGGEERTNYPVGISVDDMGDAFELEAAVLDVISAESVCQLVQRALTTVVERLVEDPSHPVSEAMLQSPSDLALLQEWGNKRSVDRPLFTVHQMFEHRARDQPQSVSLIYDATVLTFGELNAKANRLAHRLIAMGVRPEIRVGVAIERSIDLVVSLLAVMKAGGAYVPLDVELPRARVEYMAVDSGIKLLICRSGSCWSDEVLKTIDILHLDGTDWAASDSSDPDVPLSMTNACYVIYTSGSTGLPKGVEIQHAGLSICMKWMQEKYFLGLDDTVLHKAPISFDVSVWEIFWPLSVGARLVVAKPGDHRDPSRITSLVRAHGVTTINFVPSMLQAFLSHEGIEDQTRLRYVICGGEAMPAATQAEAKRRLGATRLENLYGPTETTIHVSQWSCTGEDSGTVPIGRPIAGVALYVLDSSLEPALLGVPGELFIGGELLARGYLGKAALTASCFVADPKSSNGDRLYRTGDLVRWNARGQLEFLGRIDHQVKIRGFRIELGEIEARLREDPTVREAVVAAHEAPFGTRLVGFVSYRGGAEIDVEQTRLKLVGALPEYMVPSSLVALPSLPLNANGKVDRNALPFPDVGLVDSYEAPEGPMERGMAAIWSEIFGTAKISRHANFFELGGHSLLAIRLLQRMQQVWPHHTFSLSSLFEKPTIALLAHGSETSSGIVRFHSSASSKPVLIMLHDGWGSVVDYASLASALGRTYQVIGIPFSTAGQSETSMPLTLAELAKRHCDAILALGLTGSYRIGGWSLGGALAPMVAGLLERRGEKVDFVMAIDPYVPPETAQRRMTFEEQLVEFFALLLPSTQHQRFLEDKDVLLSTLDGSDLQGLQRLFASVVKQAHLAVDHPYGNIGAADLATMFKTAEALLSAGTQPCDKLTINSPLWIWWANDRSKGDVDRFSTWIAAPIVRSQYIDENHLEIIRCSALIDDVFDVLADSSKGT